MLLAASCRTLRVGVLKDVPLLPVIPTLTRTLRFPEMRRDPFDETSGIVEIPGMQRQFAIGRTDHSPS